MGCANSQASVSPKDDAKQRHASVSIDSNGRIIRRKSSSNALTPASEEEPTGQQPPPLPTSPLRAQQAAASRRRGSITANSSGSGAPAGGSNHNSNNSSASGQKNSSSNNKNAVNGNDKNNDSDSDDSDSGASGSKIAPGLHTTNGAGNSASDLLLGTSANSYLTDEDLQQVHKIKSRRRKQYTLSTNQESLDHYRKATFNIHDHDEYYSDVVEKIKVKPHSASMEGMRDTENSDLESLSSAGGVLQSHGSRSALKRSGRSSSSASASTGPATLGSANHLSQSQGSGQRIVAPLTSQTLAILGANSDEDGDESLGQHPHQQQSIGRVPRTAVVTILGNDLAEDATTVGGASDVASVSSGRRRSVRFAEGNLGAPGASFALSASPSPLAQTPSGSFANASNCPQEAEELEDLILGTTSNPPNPNSP